MGEPAVNEIVGIDWLYIAAAIVAGAVLVVTTISRMVRKPDAGDHRRSEVLDNETDLRIWGVLVGVALTLGSIVVALMKILSD